MNPIRGIERGISVATLYRLLDRNPIRGIERLNHVFSTVAEFDGIPSGELKAIALKNAIAAEDVNPIRGIERSRSWAG